MKLLSLFLFNLVALTSSFVPLIVHAQTPPQDDRGGRRTFQIRAESPVDTTTVVAPIAPQTDPAARRQFEADLNARIKSIKDLRTDLLDARKDRVEQERREETALKEARKDRVEILRREQIEQKQERGERELTVQKNLLLNVVNALIAHVEQLKERTIIIQNNDLKNRLILSADADLQTLRGMKARIEEITSIDGLNQIAREIQRFRESMAQQKNQEQTSTRTLVLLGYIDEFQTKYIAKIEARADAIEKAIDRLETSGKNVDTARALLAAAEERIQNAKADIEEMKRRVNAMTTITGTELASIRVSLNGTKNELKTVYETFLQIAVHVKAL